MSKYYKYTIQFDNFSARDDWRAVRFFYHKTIRDFNDNYYRLHRNINAYHRVEFIADKKMDYDYPFLKIEYFGEEDKGGFVGPTGYLWRDIARTFTNLAFAYCQHKWDSPEQWLYGSMCDLSMNWPMLQHNMWHIVAPHRWGMNFFKELERGVER